MKKKMLIIVPIIIVVAIIFILIPKHNNDIKETMVETNLPEPTPEITPSPKPTAEPTPTSTPTSTPEPTPTPEENTVDDGINSTSDDVILGEDEYKGDDEVTTPTISDEELDAIAEQIYQEILAEHPEWQENTNTTTEGTYDHVGTPDTGEVTNPNYTLGESGSEGITPGTIY